jgi:DNA-binding NarL/FixJ family response regulator
MEDKRAHPRIPLAAWASVTVQSSGIEVRGYVTNISRAGIGLYCSRTLPAGAQVEIKLHMIALDGQKAVETISGVLAWQYQWEEVTLLGLRFVAPLNPAVNPQLFEIVERDEKLARRSSPFSLQMSLGDNLLTPREREIVELILQGLTNKQIGEKLGISVKTVEAHRSRVYTKMDVHNSIQLLQTLRSGKLGAGNANSGGGTAA